MAENRQVYVNRQLDGRVRNLPIYPIRTDKGTEYVSFNGKMYTHATQISNDDFLILDIAVLPVEICQTIVGYNYRINELTSEVYDARYRNNIENLIRSNMSKEEKAKLGMAAGCIPVVGFNMGAGLKKRVKKLFTLLLAAEASVGAAALIIVELFPKGLIGIFGAANESVYYTDFAVKAFRIYLCMMIFACVNKACFIFLQAIGKALESTALSMIREIVFGVGFAILLPLIYDLDGVLYSMPLSDFLTFLIASWMILRTYRELKSDNVRYIIS